MQPKKETDLSEGIEFLFLFFFYCKKQHSQINAMLGGRHAFLTHTHRHPGRLQISSCHLVFFVALYVHESQLRLKSTNVAGSCYDTCGFPRLLPTGTTAATEVDAHPNK